MPNTTKVTNDIIDINITGLKKKRFRINGDDNKILELNTSDINIATRLSEAYPQLLECEKEINNLSLNSEDDITSFTTKFKPINDKMCNLIDFIFDSNVSELCSDGGSMYDPINGFLRYEIIIDNLSALYTSNLNKEMNKVKSRVKKHTDKYTK